MTAQFFFTTPERVGARLNHFLEVTAGLRLENPQPAELKRFPKLVATLPAGEIVDVKTGSALGAFDRAVFTLEPFALFAETPKIARIEVDGAVLEVPTERIRLPRSAQSSVTEPPTDEARVGNEELDRIEQPEKLGISSESDVFWTINEIELRDAEIHLSGAASGATLTGTRLVLRDFSENGATLQINTALIAGGFKGEFLGSTAVTRSKDGRLRANALSTAFSGLAFEEKTELSLAADSLVLANEGLEVSNLSVRAQSAEGLTLSATAPRARLTEADFAAILRIDVQAQVGEETLNFLASGSLEHAFGTGRTALSQLAIDTAPGNAAGAASRLTGSLEIDRTERSGAVALDGFFLGAPAELKARIALPGLSPSERPLLEGRIRTGEPTEHETALLGLFARAARHIDFKGTLDFTGLAADAQATAFQADVIAQAGRVTVSSRNAQCFSGETAFTATLASDATWRAKAVIADGSAGSLFGVLGFSPVASGVLSGELVASGRISAETYLSKLEARGVVRTGVLKGFDLVKAVDILVADRPEETPPEVVKPEAATPFETLRFDVCLGCSSVDEAPKSKAKRSAKTGMPDSQVPAAPCRHALTLLWARIVRMCRLRRNSSAAPHRLHMFGHLIGNAPTRTSKRSSQAASQSKGRCAASSVRYAISGKDSRRRRYRALKNQSRHRTLSCRRSPTTGVGRGRTTHPHRLPRARRWRKPTPIPDQFDLIAKATVEPCLAFRARSAAV